MEGKLEPEQRSKQLRTERTNTRTAIFFPGTRPQPTTLSEEQSPEPASLRTDQPEQCSRVFPAEHPRAARFLITGNGRPHGCGNQNQWQQGSRREGIERTGKMRGPRMGLQIQQIRGKLGSWSATPAKWEVFGSPAKWVKCSRGREAELKWNGGSVKSERRLKRRKRTKERSWKSERERESGGYSSSCLESGRKNTDGPVLSTRWFGAWRGRANKLVPAQLVRGDCYKATNEPHFSESKVCRKTGSDQIELERETKNIRF